MLIVDKIQWAKSKKGGCIMCNDDCATAFTALEKSIISEIIKLYKTATSSTTVNRDAVRIISENIEASLSLKTGRTNFLESIIDTILILDNRDIPSPICMRESGYILTEHYRLFIHRLLYTIKRLHNAWGVHP